MNLYQLYYFKTMAKLEHYTKASRQLSITQPSLSHAIATLEEELDTLLFEKQGRNVVLTKNGRIFLSYVETALYSLESGTKKIKELTCNLQKTIHLGFIYTLTSQFIPDLIQGFKKDKESLDTDFYLQEGTTQNECTGNLVSGLRDGKFDLIFISLLPKDPLIEFIPICEQKLVVIMPYDSPLAALDKVDLSDIRNYPLIQYSGKEGLKQEINRLLARVGATPKICCEVEDDQAMAGLVAANIGIAIVPDNKIFHNFKIKTLPISNPIYDRTIYLGYMKNRVDTLPVQRFKHYVLSKAKKIMPST